MCEREVRVVISPPPGWEHTSNEGFAALEPVECEDEWMNQGKNTVGVN